MSRLRGFTPGLFIVGFVLMLPVLVPIGLVSHAMARRRLKAAARSATCPSCGATLGVRAIELADAAWEQFMRELREKHPDATFRVVKTVDAICPKCAAELAFVEADRSFAPAERPLRGGAMQDAAESRVQIRRDR